VVAVANAVAAAPLPATVPNIAPGTTLTTADGPFGSSHSFTITSTQANNCTKSLDATFSVAITTPDKVSTYIPFKLTFSCP
jgi:hypothetical protein